MAIAMVFVSLLFVSVCVFSPIATMYLTAIVKVAMWSGLFFAVLQNRIGNGLYPGSNNYDDIIDKFDFGNSGMLGKIFFISILLLYLCLGVGMGVILFFVIRTFFNIRIG